MNKIVLRPCVIVLSGMPLSGKTHLAKKLDDSFNFQILDVDVIRNRIDESRRNGQTRMLEPEKEKAVMIKSYEEMCKQAENLVGTGAAVLMTGTFSRAEFKLPLEQLAGRLKERKISLRVFLLTVSDKEALRRIEKRKKEGSFSNIDTLEKYQWAKSIFSKIEFASVSEIDTSGSDYTNRVIENIECLSK